MLFDDFALMLYIQTANWQRKSECEAEDSDTEIVTGKGPRLISRKREQPMGEKGAKGRFGDQPIISRR